jgi:hypothetical protein
MDGATFLESLSCGEHFLLATSILHVQRAACHDIEDRPRVIMPTPLAGRKAYCSKRYVAGPSRAVNGDGASSNHVYSYRIGDDTEENDVLRPASTSLIFGGFVFMVDLLFD